MSVSDLDPQPRRWRASGALARVFGAGLSIALAGCGFQPLYGSPSTTSSLSRVEVEVGQGRTAVLLREQLQDQLALDRGVSPAYRVHVDITQSRSPLGARVNNIANRYELDLLVRYALTDISTKKLLKQGFLPVQVSYDSADPPYAGVAAEQNAEERGAAQAALLLRLELARYFAITAAAPSKTKS